ncbi:MAG TPA: hypothetical protein VGR02_12605 [Thermoanaerobaculia bacterium]|jgi:hypothetical protein|nr:hypothetical protein [Thermoanaerobaculia bacterium]
MDLTEFTYDNILPHVGSTFRINFPQGTVDLELTRVDHLREKHTSHRLFRDSFAMQFLGPVNSYLPQGTYAMHHEALGKELPIFIVPIGREEAGFQYEAIFT